MKTLLDSLISGWLVCSFGGGGGGSAPAPAPAPPPPPPSPSKATESARQALLSQIPRRTRASTLLTKGMPYQQSEMPVGRTLLGTPLA